METNVLIKFVKNQKSTAANINTLKKMNKRKN